MKDKPLDLEDLGADPVAAFRTWYAQAGKQKSGMPEACALATATPDGRPSVRYVLLKEVDESGGFTFYTNYESRKGAELAQNPQAALAFWWPALSRQVRIEGAITRLAAAESDAYWSTRTAESRVAAATSKQSRTAPERAAMDQAFETNMRTLAARAGGPPRPTSWGGYRLWPQTIEFWQGRDHRFHDRWRFERGLGGTWTATRLWP